MTLRYRSFVDVDSLEIDECTVHACSDGAHRWWQLWFRVARETDGKPEAFVVPISPNSGFAVIEARRTWGLAALGGGEWQIAPSINVLLHGEIHPGAHESVGSLWHQTPKLVGVPDGERWASGSA